MSKMLDLMTVRLSERCGRELELELISYGGLTGIRFKPPGDATHTAEGLSVCMVLWTDDLTNLRQRSNIMWCWNIEGAEKLLLVDEIRKLNGLDPIYDEETHLRRLAIYDIEQQEKAENEERDNRQASMNLLAAVARNHQLRSGGLDTVLRKL